VQEITGTIESGKKADIIMVDGDPLENLQVLENKEAIKLVMNEGVVVSRK
jgi:imidazolonepropionase-like amidohydrolase